jgi:uncharacterized membrane protein YGL010W
MKTIEENLTQYAAYHRDRRNIATHLFGVPLIVFSLVLALSVVQIPAGPLNATLAVVVVIAATIFYLMLDLAFGVTMAIAFFAMCAISSEMTARLPDAAILGSAAGIFTFGWALQFWGHKFEGMKPAFIDDTKQLLIGPIFVVAEVFFFLGAKTALRRYIEERVGPTVARRTHPVAG